jgi:hypothetical protein
MHRFAWIPITLALALLSYPGAAAAQESERGQFCPVGEECPAHQDHEMMKSRQEAMMKQHEEVAARMQELQDRVHSTTGEARVDAIAALLDERLAQHRAMHEMMMGDHSMGMHDGMKHEGMDEDDSRR